MTESGERERFEKWANAKGAHVEQTWNGEFYDNKLVESAWQGWQAAFEAGRGQALEQAAKVAEYHHDNHCENRDTDYRNCGSAIATGIRDLALPAPPDSGDKRGTGDGR